LQFISIHQYRNEPSSSLRTA